jgi:hypothetical protein
MGWAANLATHVTKPLGTSAKTSIPTPSQACDVETLGVAHHLADLDHPSAALYDHLIRGCRPPVVHLAPLGVAGTMSVSSTRDRLVTRA